MANPSFFPDTVDGKLDHVVEECAEVILAAQKFKRFGPGAKLYYLDPVQGPMIVKYDNKADLLSEIDDAIAAMRRFVLELVESPPMT